MALIALIVGIGALAVAFGSLLFSYKVHKNNTRISDEQRGQETINILQEADLTIRTLKLTMERNVEAAIANGWGEDLVTTLQKVLADVETENRTLKQARVLVRSSKLSSVDLETVNGIAVGIRTRVTSIEESANDLAEAIEEA